MVGKKKGSPKTGGRLKGTPNKTTGKIKDAILEAFEKAGGVTYLTKLAKEDARTFVGLLGKIVPSEVKADVGDSLADLLKNYSDDELMARRDALKKEMDEQG